MRVLLAIIIAVFLAGCSGSETQFVSTSKRTIKPAPQTVDVPAPKPVTESKQRRLYIEKVKLFVEESEAFTRLLEIGGKASSINTRYEQVRNAFVAIPDPPAGEPMLAECRKRTKAILLLLENIMLRTELVKQIGERTAEEKKQDLESGLSTIDGVKKIAAIIRKDLDF